ncbi:MAG: CehA/McbA family metallohydrolase [Candidatus Hydrogenedentes bacterium]|nr:CehA/McbA family metallohydrolase [Candidatus Hydrogenedentota bacterium]
MKWTGLCFLLAALGLVAGAGCKTTGGPRVAAGAELPVIQEVEPQPLLAAAQRLGDALGFLGSGLRQEDKEELAALAREAHTEQTSRRVQEILDPYCLAMVHINPEARVKVMRGAAEAKLMQHGWRNYLIKVNNQARTRAELAWESPNAEPVLHISSGAPEPKAENAILPGDLANRFLDLHWYESNPMTKALSGLEVEYKVLQIYTTETGPREAALAFNVGQGTQDIGYRNALHVLFDCTPATQVVLRVKDDDGAPTTASLIIRDNIDRLSGDTDYRQTRALQGEWQRLGLEAKPLAGVYPLPSRRVADRDEYPDFFFQPQIYRADGEHVYLPPGTYEVTYGRGPEYLTQTKTITVREGVKEQEETFELKRWINLASMGWYSGDHHVHAGGCSHYESPEAGVRPEAMMRQAKGEDLNVSCVLTWGPCWYHQKTFFEGAVNALSTRENLMRYDVEVSGFPSSHAGHICLLRLAEDDYPGTQYIEEWPSWTMPVLHWAQQQGGVVGYAHSGWGLEPKEKTTDFPNYVMAKFDGIGANEYIVTVTQGAVDFISAGDTPLPWELNIWYHTLNCGFRTAISGETDYPCIFDERVGMARSYLKLDGDLGFDAFVKRIKEGANYVSDGRSHLLDFTVNGTMLGTSNNEVALAAPGTVHVTARVAAFLPEHQSEAGRLIAAGGFEGRPYWHLEKARVGTTRKVPVELVVNGYPAAVKEIEADGALQDIAFDCPVPHSSWIALRILGSVHTNPLFVLVDGKPVRASKRSAQWCRAAVDQCWLMKQNAIRPAEQEAARRAYDAARGTYEQLMAEAVPDGALE